MRLTIGSVPIHRIEIIFKAISILMDSFPKTLLRANGSNYVKSLKRLEIPLIKQIPCNKVSDIGIKILETTINLQNFHISLIQLPTTVALMIVVCALIMSNILV